MPEEVELAYYLRIIWRRRLLILSGTVGCMLAALVVSLLWPKKYESNLQMRIGRVWSTSLEDSSRLAAIINSEPFLDKVRQKVNFSQTAYEMRRNNIVSATPITEGGANPSRDSFVVQIVTRGYTPQEAVNLANASADLVIQEHRSRFEEWLNEHRLFEKKLEGQIQAVQNDIQELEGTLKKMTNPQVSAPSIILLQAQLEQKQVQLVGFIKELRDVKMNNSAKNMTENTRVLLPPVQPEKSVSPRVGLIVVIAGIVGVIAALAMAFLFEYFDRVNRRESASASVAR